MPTEKLTEKLVHAGATANTIPQVAASLWYGIKGGFNMDTAKPETQLARHGRAVPWTATFIDEIKESLTICRIL